MADSIPQFLSKTTRMAAELQRFERTAVEIGAMTVKTSVLAQLQAAGVSNGKLRGVGKKGAKVGVRYDVKDKNSALVRATGPFQLIEGDTKAHRTPKVRGARAKKRVVNIPGIGVRAWANVSGTKGKHPWAKGVAVAVPMQSKVQALALRQTIVKAYR